MNYKKIFNQLGIILLIEAVLMIIPFVMSICYRENIRVVIAFAISMAAVSIVGALFKLNKPERESFYAKDGYFLVALTWVLMSGFGALPFCLSGAIPNYIDAFFETVSGFTTTGSTILTEIEHLPKSILFWRAFTHFIGGMGILVFVIAIIPKTEGSVMHVMRAESPGPVVGKLVSKLTASARILYAMYCAMTFALVILLRVGGMPWFDSVTNAFATAGTGGFCALNNSIEGYGSAYIEIVITVFMLLFGINFNVYYLLTRGRIKEALKDEEVHWYLGIIAVAVTIITVDLTLTKHHFLDSLRTAFFQVASIISTTGFSSTDFEKWSTLSKATLFLLMFIGSCAGSTGGGLKVSRITVLVKSGLRSVKKAFNPRSIETVKLQGKPVDEAVVQSITAYLAIYMVVMAASVFVISIDTWKGNTLLETIGSVVTCMNNVGPAFGNIGPTGNFSEFSVLSKIVLSFDMLAGRLELIPMFMLFTKYIIPKKERSISNMK
ncbi:MAG: TrkH family potassium uptake protein [Clostridia bacterium]|nr:TrkH family potassium uptake protein [Clostridia bacterium]